MVHRCANDGKGTQNLALPGSAAGLRQFLFAPGPGPRAICNKGAAMPEVILSWCEPFDRPIAYLRPADIPSAVKFFERTGEVKALYLNPIYLAPDRKQYLAVAYPEGIEVLASAGVAGWEIQAKIIDDVRTPGSDAAPESSDKPLKAKSAAANEELVQLPLIPGVTPRLTGEAVIKLAIKDALAGEKKRGTRTIAADLKTKGISISHMKVSRVRAAMAKRGELAHA